MLGGEFIMTLTSFLLISAVVLAAATALGIALARSYFRYRGKMLFTCPETHESVAVTIAAGDAARSSLLGRRDVHLQDCTRWPERKDCGQECLSQLGADPQNCLVRTKVADWYRERSCVYCGKQFGEIHWHDDRPALLSPERKSVQWTEVKPEALPELFATHFPICWSCHIAETFRREHPERVIDRPAHRGVMGEFIPRHQGDGNKPTSVPRF